MFSRKIIALAAAAILAAVVFIAVAVKAWWGTSAYGAGPGSTQAITIEGWLQLGGSLLASLGLSWATVKTWLASKGIANSELAVDFAKVSSILAITKQLPDGPTKSGLILAGRAACDELRDQLFPGVPA